MTRGHLLPSLRRSPPPLHGAPRDQVRCLTQLTAGSQVTQGEVTRGASPPHTLPEAAQPRARPPRSLSLLGRKGLRPQPQVHPGLFQGQLLSVPGEVPAAQRGPLPTTTGEAAPESASAPGCPEVGLGPSSWAAGTHTPPPGPCASLEMCRAPSRHGNLDSDTQIAPGQGDLEGQWCRWRFRENIAMGRGGWCPCHHTDADITRKRLHLDSTC